MLGTTTWVVTLTIEKQTNERKPSVAEDESSAKLPRRVLKTPVAKDAPSLQPTRQGTYQCSLCGMVGRNMRTHDRHADES